VRETLSDLQNLNVTGAKQLLDEARTPALASSACASGRGRDMTQRQYGGDDFDASKRLVGTLTHGRMPCLVGYAACPVEMACAPLL